MIVDMVQLSACVAVYTRIFLRDPRVYRGTTTMTVTSHDYGRIKVTEPGGSQLVPKTTR